MALYDFDVYPLVAIILALNIIVGFFLRRLPTQLYLYTLLFFCFSITGFLSSGYFPDNYPNMFYILLLQPAALLAWFSVVGDPRRSAIRLLKFLSMLTVPLFLGGVWFYGVYFYGFPDPYYIFVLEFTETAGAVTLRNSAFFGSSLIFCGVALICFLSSVYLHYELQKKQFLLFELAGLLCVFMSLSRRAILPVIVFYFLLFFFRSSNSSRLKMLVVSASAILGFFVAEPGILSLATDRIWSIFDITTDKGNVSRISLMVDGLKNIIFHPFGSGLGTQSAIGYSVEEVKASSSVAVTESTVITLIGEIGFVWVLVLFGLLKNFVRQVFKNGSFIYTLPILVESIVGLGFLNPAVSFLTLIFLFSLYSLNRSYESYNVNKTYS